MPEGGITFKVAAPLLCRIVDNGVTYDDSRVVDRTNAATKLIMDHLIPVNGMATYDVAADGQTLLLPKELENAIEVEVLNSSSVNSQSDVTRGWYELVNNFTYVDPNFQHDNPLVDQFLVPDPSDPTILRRQYLYPGLASMSVVRVTGKKRYIPIVSNNDYLIVQNIEALKRVILSIERAENNAIDDSEKFLKQGLDMLQAEVQQHMLDPSNTLKRKAAYQADVLNYVIGTLGNTRGRLALEVPNYLRKGKSELNYAINHAMALIVDAENQLRISGRLGVHESVTEIAFVPALAPTDVFSTLMPDSQGVLDFDITRRLCASFEVPDPAAAQALESAALEILNRRLTERMEFFRHNAYTTALSSATPGTVEWTIARLALETPTGLKLTTTEMQSVFELSEKRIIDMGKYKDTIATFVVQVADGCVYFPANVESVLVAKLDSCPIPIRSEFFEYMENGPSDWACSGERLVDEGEVYLNGVYRRKYRLRTWDNTTHSMSVVVKLRWFKKGPTEQTTIKNFEALRLMSQAIILERSEKWQDAQVAQASAKMEVENELKEYLAGIQHTLRVQTSGFGVSNTQHGTL